MSSRSPKPLRSPSTSITVSPRRGPGGTAISSPPSWPRRPRPRPAACRRRRGGPCPWPGAPSGAMRTHSSSRCSVRRRASSRLCSRPEALLLLLQPRRVVALERVALAAVELEDPAGHVVEEVAVVGDRHDGARVVLEELLEPVDALGVEVVGRLVEQQQVRPAEQQPAQGDAAPLATRQRGDVGVVGRAAQGVHGDVDVALQAPRVGGGDPVLQLGLEGADLVVVGVGLGPHRHDLVVAIDDRLHGGDAVHDVALDVLGRVELRLLGEVAGREAGRQPGRAAEAVVEAGHDLEQARLAGAVGADDPDLGAGVERDRDVLQHRAVGRVEAGQLVAGVDELVGHDGVRGYRRGRAAGSGEARRVRSPSHSGRGGGDGDRQRSAGGGGGRCCATRAGTSRRRSPARSARRSAWSGCCPRASRPRTARSSASSTSSPRRDHRARQVRRPDRTSTTATRRSSTGC